MKIISLINNKGGVGKTTSAVNIATELAIKGHKVLLIDLDSQANATNYIGLSYSNSQGSHKIFLDEEPSIQATQYNNLYMIPATKNLIDIEESMRGDKETKLHDFLNTKKGFDYVILDCPPEISNITINALVASDYALIPTKISKFDLDGFENLFNIINIVNKDFNGNLKILGIFITMDRKLKLYRGIKEELSNEIGDLLLNTSIGISSVIARSTFEQKPIAIMSKNCKAAKEYRALVEEILCLI